MPCAVCGQMCTACSRGVDLHPPADCNHPAPCAVAHCAAFAAGGPRTAAATRALPSLDVLLCRRDGDGDGGRDGGGDGGRPPKNNIKWLRAILSGVLEALGSMQFDDGLELAARAAAVEILEVRPIRLPCICGCVYVVERACKGQFLVFGVIFLKKDWGFMSALMPLPVRWADAARSPRALQRRSYQGRK